MDDLYHHNGSAIGRRIIRVEDEPLVQGKGRYVDDLGPEGCLHIAFARSSYAHATFDVIETKAARQAPEVLGVYVGKDLADLVGIPVNPVLQGPLFAPPVSILADGLVTAIGQPIVAVVGKTRYAAEQAVELIDVAYSSLPSKPTLGENVPDLFPEIPNDRVASQSWLAGDVDAVMAAADHVVRVRLTHPRLAPASLEPRAILASWNADGERLEIWTSSQTPHRTRVDIARALNLPMDRVHAIAPDVGGAFGMKASVYPEEIVACWAAMQLRTAVKWTASRSDDFLAASHGRGAVSEGELAIGHDGKMLALRARITCPLGYWLPYSAAVPAWNAGRILPGPYAIDAIDILTEAELTTTAPVGIYRGAGRPEAAMLMERLVDEAAGWLEIDGAELRRRNLLASDRLPRRQPTGVVLDSGDYLGLLEQALSLAGYESLKQERDRRRDEGELFGIGLAFYVEPCGQGKETARLQLEPDGRVTAVTGSTAQGQGRTTAVKQILTEPLGLPMAAIAVLHGDTDLLEDGTGALASRSTAIGGSALIAAAADLIEKTRSTLAEHLDVPTESVSFDKGRFTAPTDRRFGWQDIADLAGHADKLETSIDYEAEGEAFGYGCCIATLSIDRDTGVPAIHHLWHADDAGNVINPTLVEGQLTGGIAQGLGEALLERLVYDEAGQLLTGSLMDYTLPRANDMPPLSLSSLYTPSPFNLLGAKGVGEAGCIGTPAAIMNAVHDALSPLGVRHLDMPLTSERIWHAMTGVQKLEEKR